MQAVYFISDLHLRAQDNETDSHLDRFLERFYSGKSNTLYILGDLFDFWIGDDGADYLGYGDHLASLRRLCEQGTQVLFMHGNRDFLIGPDFSEATGVKLLADPTIIELGPYRCLLKHGDDLCTDDVEHQQFRQMTRSQPWQQAVLSKPIDERLAMASKMRQMSGSSYKPSEIMDVNEHCIEQTFVEYQADILIHGHTHRPGIHTYHLDNLNRQRIVLGDWHAGPSYLKFDDNGFDLKP